MKSHQTSVGIIFLALALGSGGCTIVQKPREAEVVAPTNLGSVETPKADAYESPTAEGEVSIQEDLTTIEELRKNIPEQKRRENDALKEILLMLGEVKTPPAKHRDKFNRVMRDMREKRRRTTQKSRENYNRKERKDREAFLKDLKNSRDKFIKAKPGREDRQDFFNDQDIRRREYFANERDARREFDSELRQQDSDFNAFYREKTDEFGKELRVYTQSYNDVQKNLKEKDRERERSRQNRGGTQNPPPTYQKLGTDSQ